jgi:hypothetical protein
MNKVLINLFSPGKFLFEEAILAILFFRILPQFNSHLPFWLVIAIMLLYAIYYCMALIVNLSYILYTQHKGKWKFVEGA